MGLTVDDPDNNPGIPGLGREESRGSGAGIHRLVCCIPLEYTLHRVGTQCLRVQGQSHSVVYVQGVKGLCRDSHIVTCCQYSLLWGPFGLNGFAFRSSFLGKGPLFPQKCCGTRYLSRKF